ncbi:MAG: DUF2791 family P-loop domain-containing protein [Candidatus Cloacimonetes bacterium]|nr:DUF2791 family P-loop domain-containing protein [Candidatus Cloacimonadota bacterium]
MDNVILLETIRTGIPTRNLIKVIPDLRTDLMKTIDADLNDLESGRTICGRIVWGDYGQGKTHFLKLAEKHILSQGYAVSYYSLNRDLGLNNLMNLFPALTSRVLTSDANLPGLLNQITDNRISPELLEELTAASAKLSHPLPLYVLEALLKYELKDMIILYNTLMGRKENVTRAKKIIGEYNKKAFANLPKFLQRDHLISFMEFFPYLLKTLGYKGWVILIDELEIIAKQGKIGRLNSYKNLAWLLNMNKLHNLPIYTLAASVNTLHTDVFRGTKKNDAIDMPKLASERFDSQVSKSIEEFFIKETGPRNLVLAPVSSAKLKPFLEDVLHIHQQAILWKHQPKEDFISLAIKTIDPSNKPIRQIIRLFIEVLDIFASTGIIPGSFQENLQVYTDLDGEFCEPPCDENNDSSGFTETKLQDMFD